MRVEGPAAAALDRAFERVWGLTGEPLPDGELAAEVPEMGTAAIRVLVGEPDWERAYRVTDYVEGRTLGTVHGPVGILNVQFKKHLLLEAIPE